jgi:hypothetical protein
MHSIFTPTTEPTAALKSIRSVALTSGVGVLLSVVLAFAVGGPMGIIFACVAPLTVGVLIAERLLERRAAAHRSIAEIAKLVVEHPDPVELLTGADHRATWWQAGLPEPDQRFVRIGIRRLPAHSLAPGAGKKLTTLPVLVDLTGGIEISGAPDVLPMLKRALRVNRAQRYSPLERSPKIHSLVSKADAGQTEVTRWLLEVDHRGRGLLRDRLGREAECAGIEVDLLASETEPRIRSLETPALVLSPADLDLLRHGPHALVSGVTGSGKTEFLISWLWHMAQISSPEQLAIAVIDFKGGGSFGRLRALPHLRHLVSDLDPADIDACRDGIAALMVRREQLLAQHGVADIAQVPASPAMPHVVLVVDEYRALCEAVPGFVPMLHDVLARGRALGIHAVLSTQRFESTARDALTANIDLRIVFRAGDRTESLALLGVPTAYDGNLAVGHALVRRCGVISAMTFDLREGLRMRDSDLLTLPPLWLESTVEPELASWVELAAASKSDTVCLGIFANQVALSRDIIRWVPKSRGVLIACGGGVHERRQLARVIEAQRPGVLILSGSAPLAWDQVEKHSGLGGLLVPEFDSLVHRMPSPWREEFVEMVFELAYRLTDRGLPVALGFTGESALFFRFSELPSTRVDLLAGANSASMQDRRFSLFSVHSTQVKTDAEIQSLSHIPELSFDEPMVVITSRPMRWQSFSTSPNAMVSAMTPQTYISQSREMTDASTRIVIDTCSPSEFRMLRLSDQPLPPPLRSTGFELQADGALRRVLLPTPG